MIQELENAVVMRDENLQKDLLDALNRETNNLYYYLLNLGMSESLLNVALIEYLGIDKLQEMRLEPNPEFRKRLTDWGLIEGEDFAVQPLRFLSMRGLVYLKNFEALWDSFEDFKPIIKQMPEPFFPRLKYSFMKRFDDELELDFTRYLVMLTAGLERAYDLPYTQLFINWMSGDDGEKAQSILDLINSVDTGKADCLFENQEIMNNIFGKVSLDLVYASGGKKGQHWDYGEDGELLLNNDGLALVGDIFKSPNNKTFDDLVE